MPSTTPPQARLMAACSHGAHYSSCPPVKVAREFNRADKGSGILGRAHGGAIGPFPYLGKVHGGFLHSKVPGRTDHLHVSLGNGSYVVPADVVSGYGEGNSLAGARKMDALFKQGPYGSTLPHHRASGGREGGDVPILAAGGEYVISPDVVRRIGHGDQDKGFRILDAFVMNSRKKHIKTLGKLKPPKKD